MNEFNVKHNLSCTYNARTVIRKWITKKEKEQKKNEWSVNEKLPVILLMKQTTDCMTPYQINYVVFFFSVGLFFVVVVVWLPEVMTGLIL